MNLTGVLLLTAAAAASPAAGTEVLSGLPTPVRPEARYVFYLHGRIIEEQGVRPTSPRFGTYEYEEILGELAKTDVTVISEPRQEGTVAADYAAKVAGQVRALIAAGVPETHITVAGFSKGGVIAMMVSSELQARGVNYVFMASCGSWLSTAPQLHVSGRVLSLFEASDDIGRSCANAFEAAGALAEHREIELHLGGGHGAFYRPHPEWIDPLLAWAASP